MSRAKLTKAVKDHVWSATTPRKRSFFSSHLSRLYPAFPSPSCASGFPCLASTFHSAFGFPCPSPPTCFGLMPVRAKPEGVWSILWISILSPCPAMKFSASHISSMSTQPVCHEERKKKKFPGYLQEMRQPFFTWIDSWLKTILDITFSWWK